MGKKRTGGSEQTGKAQRQAQEALDASEAKYRDLVDNALVGVYTSTLGGDLIYANQALATMFGFASPEEMVEVGVLARYRKQADREALLRIFLQRAESPDTCSSAQHSRERSSPE
jgi:PAS domain S-box-containing protein